MPTERQKAIARALTLTIPRAPFADAEPIRQAAGARHLRHLPPPTALWLAAVAHIRHVHTDYDTLMDDGYGRDAARFFVLDAINAVLDAWGATRHVDGSEPLDGTEADEGGSQDEPD
ncbi:DUF2293 domain-containing protein [Mangrovibrevibacter kandeliae]|uniref:DUF2293 domain-containing protein n=1 Tax=Mangrovibrevibacter kandeliae TaxID=2968473 RepID=UPI002117C761|nr:MULTISPECIES: DUF2293 domain-containing protein [unclassified Aurantimonas]MCQ8783940.1 DUF2293 domain-containing protein [Aurantimonas sp. CSK15Z-1]MCW4116657.1 DUF2293 domain-containing protein [Aurantimonas sp. MSK8Z-1]